MRAPIRIATWAQAAVPVLALVLVAALAAVARPARALDLELPGEAELTREEVNPEGTYFLPVGPFADDRLPVRELEGRILRQAWRIDGADLTTLQLFAPLRAQLRDQGYEILFDCVADECGGFDFRTRTDILPAPDMLVDLFDFRFLAARKGSGAQAEHVSCLVSLAGGAGYVQLIVVTPAGEGQSGAGGGVAVQSPAHPAASPAGAPAPQAPPPQAATDLIARLQSQGHVILGDLDFTSGSASLREETYRSLTDLAEFLKGDRRRRILLVGHTDAVGALEPNLALSRARAEAVLERLVAVHGVAREQLEAAGAGYLAPVAPNTTEQGREANRRVEAVLLDAGGGQ